jgi:hypothetical protein
MELSEQPHAVKKVVQFGLVDILVIDFYALHIRTIDAFKGS